MTENIEKTDKPKTSTLEVLNEFLTNGSDWERMATSIQGVSIVRMPAWKERGPKLAIEVLPNGFRKGIFFDNLSKFELMRTCFEPVDKLRGVFEIVQELNGKKEPIPREEQDGPSALEL